MMEWKTQSCGCCMVAKLGPLLLQVTRMDDGTYRAVVTLAQMGPYETPTAAMDGALRVAMELTGDEEELY